MQKLNKAALKKMLLFGVEYIYCRSVHMFLLEDGMELVSGLGIF